MADPTYTLSVEFVTGSFTNISSYCTEGNIERQLATIFAPPSEGRAMFTLVNDDNRFSPQSSGSPYFPNMRPGRNLKLEATYSGSTYPIFRGRITDVTVNPQVGQREVLVEAGDDVNRLVNAYVTTSLFINATANDIFSAVMSLANVNSFSGDSTIQDVIPFAWANDEQVNMTVKRLIDVGNYSVYEDAAGTYRLKHRHWQQGATSIASYTAVDGYDSFEFAMKQDSVRNRIRITGQPRRARASVGSIAWLNDVVTIPSGQRESFWLDYVDTDDPNARAPAAGVVTPVPTTDFTTNTLSSGGGTDRTSAMSLFFTAYGETAVASLYNGAGETVYVTKFVIRGQSAQLKPKLSSELLANSSQSVYGRKEFTLDSDMLSNQSYIDNYTEYLLESYREPVPIVKFSLRNQFPDVLARELGDVVNLLEPRTNVGSQWQITSIMHNISLTSGLEHEATYELRAQPDLAWLVLDHATRGKLDNGRLGF